MHVSLRRICISSFLLLIYGVGTRAAQDAVDIAAQQIGKPYAWGDDGPDSFDCSGLTEYSYAQVGITIHRAVAGQAIDGIQVTGPFQRGDLLFFATDDTRPGEATHVGIFESGTTIIHAPRSGQNVERKNFGSSWWTQRYLFARRIQQVSSVSISPVNPSLLVGQTVQLMATAKDLNGNPVSVPASNFSWVSSNAAIATVSATGLVTGAGQGSAQVTVTESSSDKNDSTTVTVTAIGSLSISPVNPSALVGQTIQLTATAKDLNGNPVSVPASNFSWVSSNTAIATVSATGLVTGAAQGSAQITVTESSSGKTTSTTITVTGALAVVLNPYGSQTISSAPGPYIVQVVNPQSASQPIIAPADITVIINRQADTCEFVFNDTATVLIPQGQSATSVPKAFAVGRDQACFNIPVTTTWTVLGASMAPNTMLDLSQVQAELSLSVTR